MEKNITLRDIANALNVSVATVSLALRSSSAIKLKTRLKVQEEAKRLGYTPDPNLRALAKYRLKKSQPKTKAAIAIVADRPEKAHWATPYFDGVKEMAQKLGYSVLYFQVSHESKATANTRILRARGVTGLLIAPLKDGTKAYPIEIEKFSTVSLSRHVPYEGIHIICPNHYIGMKLMLSRLHSLGYRKPAFWLIRNQKLKPGDEWLASFHYWCDQFGMNPICGKGVEIDEQTLLLWVSKHKIDVLITSHFPGDFVFEKARVRSGASFDIACFNAGLYANMITGIDENWYHIGVAGVTLLDSMLMTGIRGSQHPYYTLEIEPTWVAGRSALGCSL